MEIVAITPEHILWDKTIAYAEKCHWRAGKFLAEDMIKGRFVEWERVFIAMEGDDITGFCVASKTDCINNVPYTPYIGTLFVDEKFRGSRLSQKMIIHVMQYLKTIGFKKVYIVSDHENLYEKYGFSVIDRKQSDWGTIEKIYMQLL